MTSKMSTASYHPVGGLKDLEHGLKILYRCELMAVPEFKNMYGAIERHYRDIKLAHLTGKAKDLQDKAVRDTKFYNILVKMLCEVSEYKGEQMESLKRVHLWYMANKHVLFSGPHFGKDHLKEEAKDLLRQATAQKRQVHVTSEKLQPLSSRVRNNQPDFILSNPQTMVSLQKDSNSFSSQAKEGMNDQQPFGFPSEFDVLDMPFYHAAPNSPELELDEKAPILNYQHVGQADLQHDDNEYSSDVSLSPSPPRIFLRPKTASVMTSSALKELTGNHPVSANNVRNVVHPISSLVNPHTTLAKLLSHAEAGQHTEKKSGISMRSMSAKPSRSESLQAWQTFNKKRSYGQDIIGKLNFVGRSGTALDIRYSAHGHGETPEADTQGFLKNYTKHRTHVTKDSSEQNVFSGQSLEEFYKTAENIMPKARNSSNVTSYSRIKSATPRRQSSIRMSTQTSNFQNFQSVPNLSPQFEQDQKRGQGTWSQHLKDIHPQNDSGVKLDTMINVIDVVSDSMVHFKEKLAPEPQLGFRQPSATGLPFPREISSSYIPDVPIESPRPNTFSNQFSNNEASISSLPTSTTILKEDVPGRLRRAKIRSSSACVIDWRGRIQPETIRYKWGKTNFGSHTYLKKWYQPNLRSAGNTSGRVRPKTAPITAKEKWKTHQPSDKNSRAVQAASHRTMVVDQAEVNSMVLVQQLISAEDRTNSEDGLLELDHRIFNKQRKVMAASSEQPVVEFLSFVAPSLTGLVELKPDSSSGYVEKSGDKNETAAVSYPENLEQNQKEDDSVYVPHSHFDEDALDVAVREELGDLQTDSNKKCDQFMSEKQKEGENIKNQFYGSQSESVSVWRDLTSHSMTSKVERSAGRMPSRTSGTSAHMLASSKSITRTVRRASPSIPTPKRTTSTISTKSGPFVHELEHRARNTKHPKNVMEEYTNINGDLGLGTTLRICKLQVSTRENSSPVLTQHGFDETTNQFTSVKEKISSDRQFTSSAAGNFTSPDQSEDMTLHQTPIPTSSGLKQRKGHVKIDVPVTHGNKATDKIGRPIAQVSKVSDPEKLSDAIRIQKEAAAAVDIQRIFRGYVARSVYKKLLSKEIQRREEARKAAVKIQRIYRGHLAQKHAIYNRPHLNPELVQWSRNVKAIQLENDGNRQAKLALRANEISSNQRQARNKLNVIGPHVQIYAAYHPKRTGPTKKELNQAAVKIQKSVRGWLVRQKMQKLSRKAVLYGSNFYKLAKEYKAMLIRVQQQHGVDKAKSPFSTKDFSDYIDLRRRYESIFQKRSCDGELEQGAIEAFFKECDLYPSQAEVDEALDVTLHGRAKNIGNRGLSKKELLNMIFYIYVPPAVGLKGTRRSTWMNPIIDGQEAKKLLGSEFVEPAPLAHCLKLVMKAKRERSLREQAQRELNERRRIDESRMRGDESMNQE